MVASQRGRACLCLLTGGLAFHLSQTALAFTAAPSKTRAPSHAVNLHPVSGVFEPRVISQVRGNDAASAPSLLLSLCGAALATVAAERVLKVGMRSQGQGGRANFGQAIMPRVKGGKKAAVFRPIKNYGSHSARQAPRRYELYDILEELDEKVPWYTVISEPEEPQQAVMDVPLNERYPWAGKVYTPRRKHRKENKDPMEPLFGSITGTQLPPTGRMQRYLNRRGWPQKQYPPWLTRPMVGEEVEVPGDMAWKKDRRPESWQLKDGPAKEEALQRERRLAGDEDDEMDYEDDDMDSELEALSN